MEENNKEKQKIVVNRGLRAYQKGNGECTLELMINNVTGDSGASYNGKMRYGQMTEEIGYMGNKWKVCNALPFVHRGAKDIQNAIKEYDVLCAVDTNSKTIGDMHIDFGSAFRLTQLTDGKGNTEVEALLMDEFIGFHADETEDFEKKNWIKCIELIQKNHPDAKKVLIIVDSDYRNIEYYNSNNEKILGTFQLPQGFVLGYASSDRSGDWRNKLIKIVDKHNNNRLQESYRKLNKRHSNL